MSAILGYGTGRRKTSVARIFLRSGSGKRTVNGKPADEYFGREVCRLISWRALQIAGKGGEGFDIYATVTGGGESSQAGAICHGVTRALIATDPELKPALKSAGLVRRDSRKVERKKVGLHKARRAKQFSKR